MTEAIVAEGLVKKYGDVTALDGIDLEVREGSVMALLGPNGAGKTTAVRIFTTLLIPDGGRAKVAGLDVVEDARALRSKIGASGQYAAVDEYLTGYENLDMVGRLYHLGARSSKARARELLEQFDLVEAGDRPVKGYSGGMRRRLDLAGALVARPQVLFLDEPTTGLDPQARHLIWQRLRELTQQGKTLLLTTHFMDEAERLCHRLAVMDNGKLISQGSPRELIEQNIEPQVVEVFGETSAQWANEHAAKYSQRFELSGESAFCYVRDAQPLVAHLQAQSALRYVHRPANLEDVFLKLTGREMRE